MTKEEIVNKQWDKHKTTTKQFIFDCMEEYAEAKARPHQTIVNGEKTVHDLETLLQQECDVCGDVDGDNRKECGCHTDGFNHGITKAIAIIEENYQ